MLTRVQNGTGAGTKPAPKLQKKENWVCKHCGHTNVRYYWITCPYCGKKR